MFTILFFIFILFSSNVQLLSPGSLFVYTYFVKKIAWTWHYFKICYSLLTILGPVLTVNCKILHGGTLSQPWPNVCGMRLKSSENFASSSDALSLIKYQKKFSPQFEGVLFSNSIQDSPKKVFTAICSPYSAGIRDWLMLTATFLSNRPDLRRFLLMGSIEISLEGHTEGLMGGRTVLLKVAFSKKASGGSVYSYLLLWGLSCRRHGGLEAELPVLENFVFFLKNWKLT